MRALEVLATGPLALVQDLGRPGLAAVGVTASGAADRSSLRLANRLVANPEDSAGVECLLGGLVVRARGELLVALTGAPPAGAAVGAPVRLRDGEELRLAAPASGLRTYLAVRGGVDVPPVLGSRSTDTLAGLGPPALRPGDVLRVGAPPSGQPVADLAPVRAPADGPVELRALPGPRLDWLADPSRLGTTTWRADERSDRVGLRLDGPPLVRADLGELPSEGVVRGAVQVPPDGRPVLFLTDHPVTGGYPVVAVLLEADADRAAQVRPGQPVRLRVLPPPAWSTASSTAR